MAEENRTVRLKRFERISLRVPGYCGQRRCEDGRGPRPPLPGGRQDRCREGGHIRRRCRRGGCLRPSGSEGLAPDAALHLLTGAGGEGMPARHHFVEDHAQRPDIVGFLGRAADASTRARRRGASESKAAFANAQGGIFRDHLTEPIHSDRTLFEIGTHLAHRDFLR